MNAHDQLLARRSNLVVALTSKEKRGSVRKLSRRDDGGCEVAIRCKAVTKSATRGMYFCRF